MGRRRIALGDRESDPLSGLVNLWNVSLALTVGLVVATLSGLGLAAIATGSDFATVLDPGGPATEAVTRVDGSLQGDALEESPPADSTLLGELYRLPDGKLVYVPADPSLQPPSSTTPYPEATPYPSVTPTPSAYPTPTPAITAPAPTPTPTWYPSSTPGPIPDSTGATHGRG
jgi:hypothetical protein